MVTSLEAAIGAVFYQFFQELECHRFAIGKKILWC
jgi:hypothetical protein